MDKVNVDLNNLQVIEKLVEMKRKTPEEYQKFMQDMTEVCADIGKRTIDALEQVKDYGNERGVKISSKRG